MIYYEFYFGKPRNKGTSHHVYKTPWSGDPRVNIQNSKGKVKPYQVKQILQAIEKLMLVTCNLSVFVTRNVSGFILSCLRDIYEPDAVVTGDKTDEIYGSL